MRHQELVSVQVLVEVPDGYSGDELAEDLRRLLIPAVPPPDAAQIDVLDVRVHRTVVTLRLPEDAGV